MSITSLLKLVPASPSWPSELDRIDGPPRALWLRGRTEELAVKPRVALVGSRAPTPYGLDQAHRIAVHLARAGVCIVSGLARGIDQAAHRGALDAGGATLALLGSGVDTPWPTGPLTERMTREALLMSEFAPGERPKPHHFPLRNRLISGLSKAVVVIEAAEASGSLITARWAADQGREVFALPGRIDHPMAAGAHRLIREGATLLSDPDQILDELGLENRPRPKVEATDPLSRAGPLSAALLEALRGETLTVDELAERSGEPLSDLLVELVGLELKGAVLRGPGGLYRLGR